VTAMLCDLRRNRIPCCRRIAWKCDSSPTAYSINYHQVAMHAISRDLEDFPNPCIYLQLDEGSEGMDDDEDEDLAVPEVRLVPSDPSQRALST
jgi:chloride channel, nucleotide-sensitive, 1A